MSSSWKGVHCDWHRDCIFKISSFVNSTDLALRKTTAQSSTDYNGFSKRAVDGNLGPYYSSKSCTHTKKEQFPWWRVDLGREYIVTGVWCKAMFTELYWIDFAVARKPHLIGLLLNIRTVISVQFLYRDEAAPRRSLQWGHSHISEKCSLGTNAYVPVLAISELRRELGRVSNLN